MIKKELKKLICEIPKAENHIHIESSIPHDLVLRLGEKNRVHLPFSNTTEAKEYIRKAVVSLDTFMEVDRLINSTLKNEEDYAEVIMSLAKNASEQNIIYQEFMISYGVSDDRKVPLDKILKGYEAGRQEAQKAFNINIIFLANIDNTVSSQSSKNFIEILGQKYRSIVPGVGLDCEEYDCKRHQEAFELAGKYGFYRSAHCGEGQGPENIWDAINYLKVDRLDHGVRAIEDDQLVRYLVEKKMLLTVCPKSNIQIGMYPSLSEHPIKKLFDKGVKISINSDDPPYTENNLVGEYIDLANTFELTEEEIISFVKNGFKYSIAGAKYGSILDQWLEKREID